MVIMYLELTPEGKNEEPLIIYALAWSQGMSRNVDYSKLHKKVIPRDPNPEFNTYPREWKPETVNAWLIANNMPAVAASFEHQVTGREMFHITSDLLKEMGVGVLERVRYIAATNDLIQNRWGDYSTEQETREREDGDELNVQDLSITLYMDDRLLRLIHALGANQAFKKGSMTVYHGQRRHRRNNQIDDDEDDPYKAKLNDPLIQFEFSQPKVTSLSAGGSGGEDRLTVNISLVFKSFIYRVQQFPGDAKGNYLDYFPRISGCEVNYNLEKKTTVLREWGKVLQWNHSCHYAFPEEFQKIVKVLLLVHRRTDEGNYLQYLPDSTLDLVILFLSQHYLPVSPFHNVRFPGPVAEADNQ